MHGIPRRTVLASAAGAAVGVSAFATPAAADAPSTRGYVDVQLLNITDLHGVLQPPAANDGGLITGAGGATLTVGGVGYLATHLDRLRDPAANSLFFSSGDNFSGWPYSIDSQNNEPTVEVLNAMGLQFSSLGNHELDKGPGFFDGHMVKGRHYGYDAPFESLTLSTGRAFRGADWQYYSGSVVRADTGRQLLPAYNVEHVQGPSGRTYPIGFIHLTVEGCVEGPGFNCSYQPSFRTTDLVESANRSAAELKQRGVRAMVIVMHEGGYAGDDYNAGTNPTGPAFDIAARADADIAAVITGHWHCRFNMLVPGPDGRPRPVVEAGYYGQLINETRLFLDPETGEVVRELTTSTNHAVTRDVPLHKEVQGIADYWSAGSDRLYAKPVARITGDLTRTQNADGETALGNFCADFLVWSSTQYAEPGAARAPRPADLGILPVVPPKARTALTGDLLVAKGSNPSDADGTVLFGEAWTAYGFDSPNMSVTITGAKLHEALEQQWQTKADGTVGHYPLAVSKEVSYEYDTAKPVGQRVDAAKVTIGGKALDPSYGYRLAINAYTVLAYDGYPALTEYSEPVRHTLDHEGFVRYLRTIGTVVPPKSGRAHAA